MLIVSVVTAVYIFLFKNNYNDVPTIIMLEEEFKLLEENGALSCMPPGMPQAYNGIIGIWHSTQVIMMLYNIFNTYVAAGVYKLRQGELRFFFCWMDCLDCQDCWIARIAGLPGLPDCQIF